MLNAPSDIDPDTIFSPFDLRGRPAVVAAVSGGSDSLAMLLLLRDWLERRAPHVRLTAVTVDHRLRAASADEAAMVATICTGHRIAHRILVWGGDKPATGLSEAARRARYRLLRQAALDAGTDVVVTGHTADDQAETVLMRSRRGDGLGLAGMAPATLLDGDVWLVRPLLGVGRAALRALLDRRGVIWVDDPSNVDRRFERARVRMELAAQGGKHRLLEIAGTAAARRRSLAERAAALVAGTTRQMAPGLLHLDARFSRLADGEAAGHALRALLAVVGGSSFLPEAARTEELLGRLAVPGFRGTLSRALIMARRDGIWLARETRGLPAPGPARAGAVWDGRYRIGSVAEGAVIAPRCFAPAPPIDAEDGAPAVLRRAARAAVPVRLPEDDAGGAWQFSPAEAAPVLAPYRHMLPSFDLPLAGALAKVIGAAEIPRPPFAGHNG